MKTIEIFLLPCLIVFGLGGAFVLSAQEASIIQNKSLHENLMVLEPLINKKWIFSRDLQNEAIKFDMTREWQPIWDGKVIKFLSACTELKSQVEGFIYYDSDVGRIAYFIISNKNNHSSGFIEMENGRIVMQGYFTSSNRKIETKNTYEITPEGKLIDTNYGLENGVWRVGHMGEFKEKK